MLCPDRVTAVPTAYPPPHPFSSLLGLCRPDTRGTLWQAQDEGREGQAQGVERAPLERSRGACQRGGDSYSTAGERGTGQMVAAHLVALI